MLSSGFIFSMKGQKKTIEKQKLGNEVIENPLHRTKAKMYMKQEKNIRPMNIVCSNER